MPRVKLPTVAQCVNTKNPFNQEPPWVYLEREMIEKDISGQKPYNRLVGNWLLFLKDLKAHYAEEKRKQRLKLEEDVGPPWFCFLTPKQQEIISQMQGALQYDCYYKTYIHVYKVLRKLGITTNITPSTVLAAIKESGDDPGVFIWALYTLYYKTQPCDLLPKYSRSQKIFMTSMVYFDYVQCLQLLRNLTDRLVYPDVPPPKKRPKDVGPKIKNGIYLTKMYAPYSWLTETERPKPLLQYKVKYYTNEEYDELAQNTLTKTMLCRQKEQDLLKTMENRKTTYKFWQPPTTFRTRDPTLVGILLLMTMLKAKARPSHVKYCQDTVCQLGTVTYAMGLPHYSINSFVTMKTPYIFVNGGCCRVLNEYVVNILGSLRFPKDEVRSCAPSCDCSKKWDINRIKEHLKLSAKCLCEHRYDFKNTDKPNPLQLYFRPPTRHFPFTVDMAMIMDPSSKTEFIKSIVEEALKSETSMGSESASYINPATVPTKLLLMSFFGDLMDSVLLIPHLPKSYLLPNIQAWVRKRIKGPMGPQLKKNLTLKSERAWVNIRHQDFRQRAHGLTFTREQLEYLNFTHKEYIEKIKEAEFRIFIKRSNLLRMTESELVWASYRPWDFASKSFIRTFFAYMSLPGNQTFYLRPYGFDRPCKKLNHIACPITEPEIM